MIAIKSNLQRNLDALAEHHCAELKPSIIARLGSLKTRQQTFINQNIDRILTGKPKQLSDLLSEYKKFCTAKGRGALLAKNINKGLKSVFNYKHFSRTNAPVTEYSAYTLVKKLDVNTCPYCNRNYTVTVDKKKRVTRPDIDHFISQAKNPLVGLSFYNLIPSCLVCNRSVKNQQPTVYGRYIHPYEEGFGTATKFNFFSLDVDSLTGLSDNYIVTVEHNTLEPEKVQRCVNNCKLFKLPEIYDAAHHGEIADIVRRHYISGGKYLEMLQDTFPQLGSIDDLYKIAFGTFWNEEDFIKRPLSKLTKDIVDQLVFINPVKPKSAIFL
ncbi:hypothetical protein LX99_04800 [Mucilaginibacter oryzae]|uniref:HNH endonuclease n=1 Tax=Mucilaginibacter oryzae TaxID=468058 RepID=A0A316GY84_9SPHI|nr:hypothetical protein [Mucilaginibacter oryzae]PWK68276.1 hypothetical protein LX99_04800 [Mucilaginibacter oryzae]